MHRADNSPKNMVELIVSHDEQYATLQSLPEKIRDFVMNDSTFSISEEHILRDVKSIGAALTFLTLRLQRSRDSFNEYGPDHPNAETWIKWCQMNGYDSAMV